MKDFLLIIIKWMGSQLLQVRRVHSTMHKASFTGTEPLVQAYFFTIANLSKQEIEVTHVWMKCRGEDIAADQSDRPLPKRLKPDESWATWIELEKLPEWIHDDPIRHGRIRLSTGKIIKTKRAKNIPSSGNVPGGPLRSEYSNPQPHSGSGPSEDETTSSEQNRQKMPEKYDVQQVCENGHKITGRYRTKEQRQMNFCDRCGEKTITACKNCGLEIQGDRMRELRDGSWELDKRVIVPSYCRNCGEPYPWTQRRIRKAIKILMESGKLDKEEKETIEQDIYNISKNIPDSETSAWRIKRIWEKCGRAGYEVIMELASRTAAKIFKEP